MKFTKKDLVYSIITGLLTGVIAWRIFEFLHVPRLGQEVVQCIQAPCPAIGGISWAWLVVVIPVAWIIGVNLGYFLGRWLGFFNQFGRFAAVGFTNAAVDFGILNLLIAGTGITGGVYYSLFKASSFVLAMLHSYFWNRIWVFEAGQNTQQGLEFAKFFTVTLLSALLNIAVATVVVNFVHPVLGLDAKAWANIGAVVGSAVALLFSFIGFKLAVFKK